MKTVRFALLRHGVTDWNAKKRIQGHSDISLRPESIAFYKTRLLPQEWRDVVWYCTPLARTRETADALSIASVVPNPALIEMNWGAWEGKRLRDLRAELGDAMRVNEDRGWDFRPDGGESPRDVLTRVEGFLQHATVQKFGAVTHKGVIRAVYAAAKPWNMMGKSPDRLDWQCLHVFEWSQKDGLMVSDLNMPLVPATEST
jgi:probable phosphoglycerate mutase